MIALETKKIISPSREAAKANAAKQEVFVLRRRQEEREAALRRVRCSFARRGKWTKSRYPKEIDPDIARIVVGSGRRFLIICRARRAVTARHRALAGPVLVSFLSRNYRKRAALARSLENQRQNAASLLTRWLQAQCKRRKRRRIEAGAEIGEFLSRAVARRRARESFRRRIAASIVVGRWCRWCIKRLEIRKRRIEACVTIQRVTRTALGRRACAAKQIERVARGRLARKKRRRLARQRDICTATNVILRSTRVALAKRRTKAMFGLRQSRANARAVACAATAFVFCALLRDKRRAVELAARQSKAAGRLTTFARGVIAKAWCRRLVHTRDALRVAQLIQRVWRGYVGRKRFAKIQSEAFRCRRCDNLEWGGRYCKQCGFARYEQPPVKIEYGNSPYAPPRVRPSFVKKMRSRIAAAQKRAAGRSFFLGGSSISAGGPETTSRNSEIAEEDARIAIEAERLARLALQQSRKNSKMKTLPSARSNELLVLSGAAKELRVAVEEKGRTAAKKQEAYLEHYCSLLQSASKMRT